jgi:hypothetical protein
MSNAVYTHGSDQPCVNIVGECAVRLCTKDAYPSSVGTVWACDVAAMHNHAENEFVEVASQPHEAVLLLKQISVVAFIHQWCCGQTC